MKYICDTLLDQIYDRANVRCKIQTQERSFLDLTSSILDSDILCMLLNVSDMISTLGKKFPDEANRRTIDKSG